MRPALSHRLAGALAALGAVVIWGLTFVPSKLALAEMGPFTLAVLRFCIALIVVLAVAFRWQRDDQRLRQLSWGTLALLGLTGVTLYFGLQNLGLARTSATEAGLISCSVPAVTAALSALVLRERMGRLRILGIVASMAGVAVVVLAGDAARTGGSVEGDLMMLGAAVEAAQAGFGPISPVGGLSLLFLGLGGSAASFFCWTTALRRLDASEASLYVNLVPVVTVVSAALLLGERLVPAQLLGGALVILGVYLAGRQ